MEPYMDPSGKMHDFTEDIAKFERDYAERSGVTVEFLRHHGRYGALCDCGEDICDGFQMAHDDVVMHLSDHTISLYQQESSSHHDETLHLPTIQDNE